MIQFYNSLSKQKELFKPQKPGKVGIYVCGMTVYADCHIGHARTMLVFDILVRFLRASQFEVNYVRNITDVDDKIIQSALREAKQDSDKSTTSLMARCQKLTNKYIERMEEDCKALNILSPDQEPKATDYMDKMVKMIEGLVEKEKAYLGTNRDVFFDVHAYSGYGQLSHRKLEDLHTGARVELDEAKRYPLDFVLWKQAKPGEKDVCWDSPWGSGRPGWHIECSAMSLDCLGETFDIHGGGQDLKFPHHENERAQSESFTGKKFVNLWMHSGFVQINQEKMSKSLRNFLTIRDCLKTYHPEVLRFFMISSHYRSPVDYSDEAMKSALKGMERLYRALDFSQEIILGSESKTVIDEAVLEQYLKTSEEKFFEALGDDLNTPIALAVLFDLASELNRAKRQNLKELRIKQLTSLLKKLGANLGLLKANAAQFLADPRNQEKPAIMPEDSLTAAEIEKYKQERDLARRERDFKKADEIRDLLFKYGITLPDKKVELVRPSKKY